MKDIKYINKDFDSLKEALINYSKNYFPNSYNDFSPSSIGMLFIDMTSYVGDVLSFYIDNQIQETFIQYARQKENLYNLAYLLGYNPKVTTVAKTKIEIYQKLPSIVSASVYVPDYSYCLKIPKNTKISSNSNQSISFLTEEEIDFSYSSSYNPTELSIYQISGNQPSFYLLKKTVNAFSANINSASFTITEPTRFQTLEIEDSNIIGIESIIDSEGNEWYEVPSLSQDFIYYDIKNTNTNDLNYQETDNILDILKIKSVNRRFVTRFLNDNILQIQFGAGILDEADEEIIPNLDNVGLGLPFEQNKMTTSYSPLNFLFTRNYGLAPSNVTLTINYLTGGGVKSNTSQNTLTIIDNSNIKFLNSNLNSTLAQEIFDSIASNNIQAADGGSDGDDINELRHNALGTFQTQLRSVTTEDYVIRALSMPPKYGAVSKVYAEKEKIQYNEDNIDSSIVLYILSCDYDKKLKKASLLLKNNLKNYISQYRMINDFIKIKDAFIINIGINFEIIPLPNFNNNEILIRCIDSLTDFFDINKWNINQPIILRDIYVLLDKIEGVQTVKNIEIINKTGEPNTYYSNYAYDIPGANINNIIYPSLDPMIFELKNPDLDIKGRIVPL